MEKYCPTSVKIASLFKFINALKGINQKVQNRGSQFKLFSSETVTLHDFLDRLLRSQVRVCIFL